MPTAILIDKKGSIKEITLKTFDESELYKKAGFKNSIGFELSTTWDIEHKGKEYEISLYGKKTGRAGQENKYEFPPPVDNTLFFGSCLLINYISGDNSKLESLSKDEWKVIYEALYGGFEDIGSEDSEDDEDDEEDAALPRTKSGYVKDDFVIDDEDELEEDTEEDEVEEDEEPVIVQKKKVVPPKKKVAKIAKDKKKSTVFDLIAIDPEEDPSVFLDCTSELEEEEYV